MLYKVFFFFSFCFYDSLYASYLSVKSIQEFVELYPETKVIQCTKNYEFNYKPFLMTYIYKEAQYPHQGVFRDIFILEVKNGMGLISRVPQCYNIPYFFVNNIFLKERSVYPLNPIQGKQYINDFDLEQIEKVKGRVAVVNWIFPDAYGHYITDVLSHLALLEIYEIEYDYLWIPYECNYMQEILDLWGIEASKIIPAIINKPIKADILIVPTATGQHDLVVRPWGDYHQDFLLQHIRKKLLKGAKKLTQLIKDYPKKIFVSRKDSVLNVRKMLNEDDVYFYFKPLGYEQVELTKYSVAEKIIMFNQATHIIGVNGAGLVHLLFAKPGTWYFEIQHVFIESTFYFISQIMNLNYVLCNLSTQQDFYNGWSLSEGKMVNLDVIKKFIAEHPEL